jgi:hypothetical protein
MIAPLRTQPMRAWHAGFLAMLPAIRRHLMVAFRGLDLEARDEAVQEGVCNALVAYHRLYQQGKLDQAYATPLAKYAVRQFHDGRKVGGKLNVHDVSSPYCRRLRQVILERLDRWDKEEGWVEILVEDRHATPADTARVRIDFGAWLRTLPRRDRKVAIDLAAGDRTIDVARKYGLSEGRISQLRKELHLSWELRMMC